MKIVKKILFSLVIGGFLFSCDNVMQESDNNESVYGAVVDQEIRFLLDENGVFTLNIINGEDDIHVITDGPLYNTLKEEYENGEFNITDVMYFTSDDFDHDLGIEVSTARGYCPWLNGHRYKKVAKVFLESHNHGGYDCDKYFVAYECYCGAPSTATRHYY